MLKSYLFVGIFVVLRSQIDSASFIKPCVWTDKKCILESSKAVLPYLVKGIPETGGLSIDPIYIKDISADNGDLKLHFSDYTVSGMSKSVLINVERPDSDKTLIVEFEFPSYGIGKYKAGGKIFVIDVEGDGDTEIKCDKVRLKFNIILAKIEKNSKKYYQISRYDYTIDVVENVSLKFTNLYNGDEDKAKVASDLLKQHGKELLIGIGKPIIKELVDQEVLRINKLFLSVPIEELEL